MSVPSRSAAKNNNLDKKQIKDLTKDVSKLLNSRNIKAMFASVDTEGLGPERIASQMLLEISNNPDILMCSKSSIVCAIMNCLKWKLEPNSDMNFVYFIPYWNKIKGEYELSCELSYLGMIQIAYRAGTIKAIDSAVMYENDDKDFQLGTERFIRFRPKMDGGDRGKKVGAYAVIELSTGQQIIEIASLKDLEDFKAASKKGSDRLSPAWTKWEDQMFCKSTLKRAFKKVPKIPELKEAYYSSDEVFEGEFEHIKNDLTETNKEADINEQRDDIKKEMSQADEIAAMI